MHDAVEQVLLWNYHHHHHIHIAHAVTIDIESLFPPEIHKIGGATTTKAYDGWW